MADEVISLGARLSFLAKERPDRPAVTDNVRTITWRELDRRTPKAGMPLSPTPWQVAQNTSRTSLGWPGVAKSSGGGLIRIAQSARSAPGAPWHETQLASYSRKPNTRLSAVAAGGFNPVIRASRLRRVASRTSLTMGSEGLALAAAS